MTPRSSTQLSFNKGQPVSLAIRSGTRPSVSIVLCTKDRREDLRRAINSVRASGQLGRSADVAVVEEAREPSPIPGVRYVHLPPAGRGFGHARNVALQHVEADIVVFLDDDCVAAPGWLEALLEPFQHDPTVVGVAGAVLVRDCGPVGYAENVLGFPGGGLRYRHAAEGRVVPTRYLSTCNCAYRRDVIFQAGGFAEHAQYGGEDSLLAERISRMGPCRYAPGAVVYHRTRDSVPAVFRWFVRRGMSELASVGESLDHAAALRYLLRSSWSLRLLIITVVLLRWPMLRWGLPALALAYYAVLLWRFRFARQYPEHRAGWWLVPIVKLTMDVGTDVGRWKALFGKVRRWRNRPPS